jgi:hypothetical protein
MIYFSFSLYGSNPKYTVGMICNAAILQKRFPEACVCVYVADDVPKQIIDSLMTFSNVKLIHTEKKPGCSGMFDRFLTIDVSDCDIMFVRDADSRVHERDAACIEDFLASSNTLHIIRDHKYHTMPIMGGMWGIRKSGMAQTMKTMLESWSIHGDYGDDQNFLKINIYSLFCNDAMIHDRYHKFEDPGKHKEFRVPIINHLFVGQVHDFKDGEEYVTFHE